ncbi:MAG: formylglycine-generating enzyme family protein [Gammaproteobacteria bacterium]|nr:formylglycine-generating enzyme family protein [Gammaproteobacteria bacterium]
MSRDRDCTTAASWRFIVAAAVIVGAGGCATTPCTCPEAVAKESEPVADRAVLAASADYVDAITGIGFVLVTGGTFEMGDLHDTGYYYESPAHTVTLSDFYISQTEVTQRQWRRVTNYNPAYFRGPDLPVDQVSWNDIQEWLTKLNRRTGQRYRLPTEAEWEYAARSGGKDEKWSGTSNPQALGDYAWYRANSDQRSHPVATKRPNGLGLYDMSGNLWEWVADRFAYFSSQPQLDPQGPAQSVKDDYRAYKGGAWDYIPGIVRASMRSGKEPSYKRRWIGFRIAMDASSRAAD